jgi:hypothetical protein
VIDIILKKNRLKNLLFWKSSLTKKKANFF